MRPAKVNQREPPLQFPAEPVGQRQLRYDRPGIFGHLDEVCAAERGADLILNAGLPSETNGFDVMRCAGDLLDCAMTLCEPVQRAKHRNDHCRGRAGRRTRRRIRPNRHLDIHVVRWPDLLKGCFEQGMRPPGGAIEDRRVPCRVVLYVEDYACLPAARRIDVNSDRDQRAYGNVEDLAPPGEPGVGPPADVTDSNWSRRVDSGDWFAAACRARGQWIPRELQSGCFFAPAQSELGAPATRCLSPV